MDRAHNTAHKQVAYLMLRLTIGSVFLCWGISKFLAGREKFTANLDKEFSNSLLPTGFVHLFATVLPFAEVSLGSLLLLGVFTTVVLVLLALLLVALTVGNVIVPSPETVAHNLVYSIAVFALLFGAEHDVWTLQRSWTNARQKWKDRETRLHPSGSGQ